MSNSLSSKIRDSGSTRLSICDKRVETMTAATGNRIDSSDTGDAGDADDRLQLTQVYRNNIAAHTKRLRERAGIRQKDLAKLMNTGQGHVASLEMARLNIGLHTLTRLANAFNVEPATLLLPLTDEGETAPGMLTGQLPGGVPEPGVVHPVDAATQPQSRASAAPELSLSNLGIGVSLTTVKEMVAATYKRLEALERRHGSVPMTRAMLTSVLVALLNASQNLDGDSVEPT